MQNETEIAVGSLVEYNGSGEHEPVRVLSIDGDRVEVRFEEFVGQFWCSIDSLRGYPLENTVLIDTDEGPKRYLLPTEYGSPVLANGAVEECDCESCLAKYTR